MEISHISPIVPEYPAEHKLTQTELYTADCARALIVGAGFAGTVTAIRLLHNAFEPLEVVMIEKNEEQRDGGLAYSRTTADWAHLLNIQAGRITAFREHPKDFMNWANEEADRRAWADSWQHVAFGESTAVPRRVYQQYLGDRLRQAEANAAPGVSLRCMNGEVVDMKTAEDGSMFVTYIEPSGSGAPMARAIKANKAILATGHIDFITPEVAKPVKTSPKFVYNQYSAEGQEAIAHLPKHETAFIIGTGLSAYDAAISLLANGHEGPIIMSSRHGYRHFTYPENHVHEILRVRRPPFMDVEHLTSNDVVAGISEELVYLKEQLHEQRPDIAASIYTERILKAWEPYVAELIQRLPAEDVQALLVMYRSLIVTSRIGTITEIGNRIADAMKPRGDQPAQIQVFKGDITNMVEASEGGRITITMSEPDGYSTVKTAELVIASAGQEADYTHISSPLWQNLVHKHQVAVPHEKTGRGIEVGPYGEVVNSQGEESHSLFAVGPMRQGDEMQRHGRLGAFVFSIGTVRNQCFETAMRVLDSLKYPNETANFLVLGSVATTEDIAISITQEVMQSNGAHRSAETMRPSEEAIRYAARLCLSDQLRSIEKASLESIQPAAKKVAREDIQQIEDNLSAELEQQRGLTRAVVQQIIQKASRYRVALAVKELTDIARLAKGLRREEYILTS